MRAYLRVDPNLADNKVGYPDGAFRAFIEVLCFAEQQHPRGVFRSRKLLAVLLERRARWITYLVEHGDIEELATGQLVVEGWTEWQEGDWKVHERVQRIRNRQRRPTPPTVTNNTIATVTSDTDPTVITPLSVSGKHSGGKQIAVAGGRDAAQPDGKRLEQVDGKYRVRAS